MYEAPTDPVVWAAWDAASLLPAVDEQLRELYRGVDAAVTERGPTCWTSGNCCRFESYGHRLFVSGLEVAWFLNQVNHQSDQTEPTRPARPSDASEPKLSLLQIAEPGPGGACPYQINGLCSTHQIRPLGCRVFFCQQGTQDWQQALYESYLAKLRTLHETHGITYRYFDWMQGLAIRRQAAATGDE